MSIMPYHFPETDTPVRAAETNESELDTLLDALLAEIAMPVALLVFEDPWLDALDVVLYGPLPELPAWSPSTEALVAEFAARTGGAR
ncbi:hypothetical protein ACFC1T_27710 [Kitasatospora sp. NPDC056076]|uniref:hypothetical protein n=1 Tax=Kitasatospora sp. NPDC056076 TaxID=3345703 RepID=UPI0035D91850